MPDYSVYTIGDDGQYFTYYGHHAAATARIAADELAELGFNPEVAALLLFWIRDSEPLAAVFPVCHTPAVGPALFGREVSA